MASILQRMAKIESATQSACGPEPERFCHPATAWRRMVLRVLWVILEQVKMTQLVNDMQKLSLEKRRRPGAKDQGKEVTLDEIVRRNPLSRSKSTKGMCYDEDAPKKCQHARGLKARGNATQMWWTCESRGSRWTREPAERLVSEKKTEASTASSSGSAAAAAAELAPAAAPPTLPVVFDMTLDGSEKMTLGRHAGKTFQEIREQYPKYGEWVVKTATEETECHDQLRKLATYLLQAAATEDMEML